MQLVEAINWEKLSGLIPAIIQDKKTNQVLMLGYMNRDALLTTLEQKWVTFFSRTKQRLWTKGESSGNKLLLDTIELDCDQDTLLLQVIPEGPTCHIGNSSCFENDTQILNNLQRVIDSRIKEKPEQSYTVELVSKGLNRVAQKVGEEAVEVVVAALSEDDTALVSETADLFYHLLVLLSMRKINLSAVMSCLALR